MPEVTLEEIMQAAKFPETTIRNKITQLIKAKKISKTKDKPFKVTAKSTKNK